MRIVLENLEEKLSEWLYLEYRHAAEIWRGALFTNISSRDMAERLRMFGQVKAQPCSEVIHGGEAVILDPRAKKPLRREDLNGRKTLIIGGILGQAKPLGRTDKLLTSKMPGAKARNLGNVQLTIDSAALVARLVEMGMPLEEIEVTSQVEVRVSEVESIHLPYGYVVLEDRLILTPGLKEYLVRTYHR